MARPINTGLQYFPLDVDFWDDPKILLIEEQFGLKGSYVSNRLLCWIYRHGYFLEWNNDMALVFAKRVGNNITHPLVNDIVDALVKKSFFDEGLFNRYSILTSKGIQTRWEEIVKTSKRKASIEPKFRISSLIGGVSSEETQAKREETQAKREESTQSKVNKSKVNKSTNVFPDRLKEGMEKSEPEEFPREVLDLAIDICNFLDVLNPSNSANHSLPFREVKCFVENIYRWEKFDFMQTQFKNYKVAKSSGIKHGYKRFIGTFEQKYQDGAWCEKTWKTEKQAQRMQTKIKRFS